MARVRFIENIMAQRDCKARQGKGKGAGAIAKAGGKLREICASIWRKLI